MEGVARCFGQARRGDPDKACKVTQKVKISAKSVFRAALINGDNDNLLDDSSDIQKRSEIAGSRGSKGARVVKQDVRAGTVLPSGADVSVKLGE